MGTTQNHRNSFEKRSPVGDGCRLTAVGGWWGLTVVGCRLTAVGGWWGLTVVGCRLTAVGGWWGLTVVGCRLTAVGGWWGLTVVGCRLGAVGGWRLVVLGAVLKLRAVLNKKENWGS